MIGGELEPRWRRAQRRRRRRLSARGRATLASLGALVLGVPAGRTLWGSVPERPPEAAPPPPVRLASAPVPVDAAPSRLLVRLPVTRAALDLPRTSSLEVARGDAGHAPGLLYEEVDITEPSLRGPLRVEYTLDAELTRRVFRTLRLARAALGHVIVMDPENGRVLAYASTDVERFPPTRSYPAASLVKVITAAAALDRDPASARLPCRFRGSPWRLTPSRLDPPASGSEVSLERALATSNNQCFAQLAVHAVGSEALLDAIARFGWLSQPAPAHDAGSADPGSDRLDLGRLGCGLAGSRITPLHAVQLAGSLARGELVPPRWIHRVVDADGRELRLPSPSPPRDVMPPERAAELRDMLVATTTRGTARHAFRKRSGRPLLDTIRTAGKTGSLTGSGPDGRYEWFIGVAPAERPRVAVAVLMVQGHLWWRSASQVAASVLESVFCEDGSCRSAHAERWRRPRRREEAPPIGARTARGPGRRSLN